MLESLLARSLSELANLLVGLPALAPAMKQLADAMLGCWRAGGKVLIAGNGGSAADAMHFAEELTVRFQKDRRALAAIALCDAAAITCAGNDFGFENIFCRQVEALGARGDVLIVLSTSGNSVNLVRAVEAGRARGLATAAFLGKGGGRLKGMCDIELLVPSGSTARIQEAHQLLFHVLCEWVDAQVD
jgi:D-sedoheptulose 7-phosphate isomerase